MTAAEEVVLLDQDGRPIGRGDRDAVHSRDTPRHLAFSCWIFGADGSLLLTRRALGKRSWPGVWTNSCCGHPRPGESVEAAVRRRIGEELGVRVTQLRCLLEDFSYQAVDPSGIMENESCPVYCARLDDPDALRPDPTEVMDQVWTSPEAVSEAVRCAPYAFSPWAVDQIALLGPTRFGSDPTGDQPGDQPREADRC